MHTMAHVHPPDHPLSNNHKINDLRNKKGGLLIWSVRNQARPPGKWAHMVSRQSQCHKVALWPCMCTLTCVCAVVHIHTYIIHVIEKSGELLGWRQDELLYAATIQNVHQSSHSTLYGVSSKYKKQNYHMSQSHYLGSYPTDSKSAYHRGTY